MEQRILGQTHGLMELLEQSDGKSSLKPQMAAYAQHQSNVWNCFLGRPINPQTLFHNASSNVICQVLFAQHFDNEDNFMKFFTNFFQVTSKIINGPWSLVSVLLLQTCYVASWIMVWYENVLWGAGLVQGVPFCNKSPLEHRGKWSRMLILLKVGVPAASSKPAKSGVVVQTHSVGPTQTQEHYHFLVIRFTLSRP